MNNPCIDFGAAPEFCCVTERCRIGDDGMSGYGTGDELRVFSSTICGG